MVQSGHRVSLLVFQLFSSHASASHCDLLRSLNSREQPWPNPNVRREKLPKWNQFLLNIFDKFFRKSVTHIFIGKHAVVCMRAIQLIVEILVSRIVNNRLCVQRFTQLIYDEVVFNATRLIQIHRFYVGISFECFRFFQMIPLCLQSISHLLHNKTCIQVPYNKLGYMPYAIGVQPECRANLKSPAFAQKLFAMRHKFLCISCSVKVSLFEFWAFPNHPYNRSICSIFPSMLSNSWLLPIPWCCCFDL